jgi:hypothetical protein
MTEQLKINSEYYHSLDARRLGRIFIRRGLSKTNSHMSKKKYVHILNIKDHQLAASGKQ